MNKAIKKICRFLDSEKEFDCYFEEIENGKEIILEVYNSGNQDYKFKGYHKIIHVEECGRYFTFFGCQFISKSSIKVSYKIEGYFSDVLISSQDDIKVKIYSVELPKYLNYIFESNEFIEDDLNYSYENIYNISDNLSIKYKSFVTDSKFGNYSVSYQLFILLEFIYTQEVDLEIVYNDLNILKQFFDFNSGIRNYINPSSVKIKNNENIKVSNRILNNLEKQTHLDLLLFNNRFFINAINDEKKLRDYNFRAFFNFNDDKQDIFKVLKKWYNNEKYRVVYQYYIDSNDWLQGSNRLISNVMFNNKFLNIIQSLESFHTIKYGLKTTNEKFENDYVTNLNKVIFNLQDDKDLKLWTTRKLKGSNKQYRNFTLCERLEEIKKSCNFMDDINIVNFSSNSKKKRDSLSHGNINEIFQGRELEIYYNYSLLLLLFSIFKTLEIKDKKLEYLFEMNFQITSKKNEIVEKLKYLNQ